MSVRIPSAPDPASQHSDWDMSTSVPFTFGGRPPRYSMASPVQHNALQNYPKSCIEWGVSTIARTNASFATGTDFVPVHYYYHASPALPRQTCPQVGSSTCSEWRVASTSRSFSAAPSEDVRASGRLGGSGSPLASVVIAPPPAQLDCRRSTICHSLREGAIVVVFFSVIGDRPTISGSVPAQTNERRPGAVPLAARLLVRLVEASERDRRGARLGRR